METLIVHAPDGDKAKAVKAVLKALGVSFEKAKISGSPKKAKAYNPGLVAKVRQGEKDYADGKYEVIKVEDLWK